MITLDWHKDESGAVVVDITADQETAFQAGQLAYSLAQNWLPRVEQSPVFGLGRYLYAKAHYLNNLPVKVHCKIV